MRDGEQFNPYKFFPRNALIPDAVVSLPVSAGAKMLYGVLRRYAGADGACHPRQAILARDMRVQERTVQRWLSELVKLGLIGRTRRGLGRSNTYTFLWKDLLKSGQLLLGVPTDMSHQETTILSCQASPVLSEEVQSKRFNEKRSIVDGGKPEPQPSGPANRSKVDRAAGHPLQTGFDFEAGSEQIEPAPEPVPVNLRGTDTINGNPGQTAKAKPIEGSTWLAAGFPANRSQLVSTSFFAPQTRGPQPVTARARDPDVKPNDSAYWIQQVKELASKKKLA